MKKRVLVFLKNGGLLNNIAVFDRGGLRCPQAWKHFYNSEHVYDARQAHKMSLACVIHMLGVLNQTVDC
jgi:hypothetical protein